MLNKGRRRFRWEAVWALGLVCGVPAFAEAQQTGLFPLRPIRRQRVPCPNEDPVYAQYRNQYYGYYPTCWHKFPEGWGCPSAEAPNAKLEYEKLPLQNPPLPSADGDLDDERMAPPGGRDPAPDNNALPPVPPGDRSPFNLDNANPRGNRPGRGPVNHSALRGTARQRAESAPGALGGPLARAERTAPIADAGAPLLTLPEPSGPPPVGPATASPVPGDILPPGESAPISAPGDPGPSAFAAPPTQAPRRKTLIGGLLGSLGLKR